MLQLSKRLEKISLNYDINKQFIKIKFHDFVQTTVEMVSQSTDMNNFSLLCEEGFNRGNKPVRLLGMGVRVSPKETATEQSSDAEQEDTIDQLSLIPEEM